MDRLLLDQLIVAQQARKAVAVVTNLTSGTQRLVTHDAVADEAMSAVLENRFRFDKSGVYEADDEEFFIQIYNPTVQLIIIGAVHIAQSLAPMARQTGYDVTVIDPRAAFASEERFPNVTLMAQWPDEVLPNLTIDHRTAFAVLTHDPKIDDPSLALALNSDAFYIGVLGSKKNHAGRLQRLQKNGLSEPELARLNGPIGLDIGAQGAPEIAVSILAQIVSSLRLGE